MSQTSRPPPFIAILPLPSTLSPLIVLIFSPLTRVSCFVVTRLALLLIVAKSGMTSCFVLS